MNIRRLEVRDLDCNPREQKAAKLAREHLGISLFGTEIVQLFWLKAQGEAMIEDAHLDAWAKQVFSDPILQEYSFAESADFRCPNGINLRPSYVAEIRFLPGVTDNVGRTATEALTLVSDFAKDNLVQVYTGKAVYFFGEISFVDAERVANECLANTVIEEIKVTPWRDYFSAARFENQKVPEVILPDEARVGIISLDLDNKALERMSKEQCWALTLSEIETIREHYQKSTMQERREKVGLSTSPTDVEMEVFAQTWSEHCKHKIFAAEIDYTESDDASWPVEIYPRFGASTVKSLFKSFIKKTTEDTKAAKNIPWLVSVFSDNAGIVRFDEKVDLCIKVETHNSPSAIDPYGGALTGIVGVNRDILGCGMGARPIANTDVFCFAPPDWPVAGEERELPDGLKHPRRIFDGVHLGVEDGGNKSGIPTVNGAFAFHRDFAGKPLVFCGTIGVLPHDLKSGTPSASKNQKPGDVIVMAGGRIGKDGIHGATFSSMELNENAPATVVQIGDPITQKRLADFLLEARDLELFSSVTDNGAGGLSSSVGEMALATNGARLDITNVPVKYPGLQPFELVVSESQERMTFAVPPEKLAAFLTLAKRRGVEATALGEFTDTGILEVVYREKTVALLDLQFLHEGLPPMILKARWEGPRETPLWSSYAKLQTVSATEINSRAFLEKALYTLLSRWNIRSKESWVRRYDHEVQAATLVKPFVGVEAHGPGDAAVIWLAPHGGNEKSGVTISCGLQPKLSRYDAYLMAQHALDEAFRNAVCVGADPEQMALIDNFCWPDPLPGEKNPDAQHKLAQLVRANRGLYDLALQYGAPFVSGKDSMKNDFIGRNRFGKEVKISVPPTVLVTAMGKVHDVSKTVTSDFKKVGDQIFLLGKNSRHMGGSELEEIVVLPKEIVLRSPPNVRGAENFKLYKLVHEAIMQGMLRSCHDCSEGGALVSLAESAMGGALGVSVELEKIDLQGFGGTLTEYFFNETPGRFVVSVAPENRDSFLKLFAGMEVASFGQVVAQDIVRVTRHGLVLVDAPLGDLERAWRGETL